MTEVVVMGSLDGLRSRQMRFLQEAARLGPLHVLLWPDGVVQRLEGRQPHFPQDERLYFLQSIRYVSRVSLLQDFVSTPPSGPFEASAARDALPLADETLWGYHQGDKPVTWVVSEDDDSAGKRAFCARHGIAYRVLSAGDLQGFPQPEAEMSTPSPGRKKAMVTGCYDWLHSGHVRFFEEVSELGALYVVVGHDANVRLLKGEGHPLFPQEERRYMVQAIRYVEQALISSGHGWMDAEPEIERVKPDLYVVNEDGDKPEKRAFCEQRGIAYVVLRRLPKEGLPKRSSTNLRGF